MRDPTQHQRRRRTVGLKIGHHPHSFRERKPIISWEGKSVRMNFEALMLIRSNLRKALNPAYRNPVHTLADMTPEEKAAIEERYGAKIKT